jgi:DNA mismatch endonuclease (patch repair protein)
MPARDPLVTSKIMAAVRSRDTRPELYLRRALHARGLRYRVAPRQVEGRPDVVFPRLRVAVFVDGDFFHGNAWRSRGASSNDEMLSRWRNADFWTSKIAANVARDHRVTAALEASGWRVVRLWESEVLTDLDGCVRRVVAVLQPGGSTSPSASVAGRSGTRPAK